MYKTLDWNKVASLILEYKPVRVEAGLLQDWSMTAAVIYDRGSYVIEEAPAGPYLSSFWALPGVRLNLADGTYLELPCAIAEAESGWTKATRWPSTALDVIARTL